MTFISTSSDVTRNRTKVVVSSRSTGHVEAEYEGVIAPGVYLVLTSEKWTNIYICEWKEIVVEYRKS